MERLSYHQGHLPLRNMILQFLGAALSIISGHSVGREGPSVHLGAASSSLLGQYMGLPNNSIRILVGCGTAAAIAASFNTPLAGVVFAMEVVMMEYTIAGFTPVILAAVSATALTRWVFGSAPAFSVPTLELGSLLELPYILLMGLVIGALAAAFITLLQLFSRQLQETNLVLRLGTAGLITGLCALVAPQIMGIGYDTVNETLLGQLGIGVLLLIIVFKMLATTAGIGLGLPGGLIGPTLVIGAAAGGCMGLLANLLFDVGTSSPAYYALLGMGAMMGATLQAPLAALTAMLELSSNPNIILPGMLAIIVANLASSELFHKNSVFTHLMRARGLDHKNDPVSQSLRRIGVSSTMERDVQTVSTVMTNLEAQEILQDKPRWLVIKQDEDKISLMPAADLARTLQETEDKEINLLEIPAQRMELAAINSRATLQEALELLDEKHLEALYVLRPGSSGITRIYGIITRRDIERSYQ
jgi:H+/Cl- antiporter ClcA